VELFSLHPLVAKTIRAFGYRSVCDSNPGNCSTERAQFRDIYNSLSQRDEFERMLPLSARAAPAVAALMDHVGEMPALVCATPSATSGDDGS